MKSRISSTARGWLVSSITAAFACGGAEIVDPTPEAPSATGSVKVERQRDRLALDILVQQLRPPAALKQGAAAYVVWAKPARGGPAHNLGALTLDADEGALRAAFTAEDTSLIVTAESTAEASAPSGQTVLWAYVDVEEPEPAAKPAPGETPAPAQSPASAQPPVPAESPAPAQPPAPAQSPVPTQPPAPAQPPAPDAGGQP
jgi:hypothetical protein